MKFQFILHSQITNEILSQIINLKKNHWDYSFEQHKEWIFENINYKDIHVLMFDNEKAVAYMNLIKIEVVINDKVMPFLGIGNVCSKEKGKGYGKELLLGVNSFLKDEKHYGLLLCKNELVAFYSKYNWITIDKTIIKNEKLKEINMMVFNLEDEIVSLNYEGRNF